MTYLGDLQPTYIGVIIQLLSTMDILGGLGFCHVFQPPPRSDTFCTSGRVTRGDPTLVTSVPGTSSIGGSSNATTSSPPEVGKWKKIGENPAVWLENSRVKLEMFTSFCWKTKIQNYLNQNLHDFGVRSYRSQFFIVFSLSAHLTLGTMEAWLVFWKPCHETPDVAPNGTIP